MSSFLVFTKMIQTEMNAVSVKLSELNAKVIKIKVLQGFISAKYNKMLSSLQTTKKQAAAQEKQLTKHGN